MICEHKWKKHDEPIKDDEFEVCEVCGVIHTVKKSAYNTALAARHMGREYYNWKELWTIVEGIPLNRHYIDTHMQYFKASGIDSLPAGSNILYVGCGIGQFVPYFTTKGFNVTCVDMDHWAIAYVNSAYWAVHARCCDFEKMPVIADHYDAVVSNHMLEHTKHMDRCLLHMIEALKPGGILYYEIPNGQADIYTQGHWWHHSQKSAISWLNALPLVNKSMEINHGKDERSIQCFHCFGRKP